MKNKAVKIIFKTLLKTFGIFFLIIGVGVASYQLTMIYKKTVAKEAIEDKKSYVSEPDAGDISSNLIYSVNDSGQIEAVILEIFNTETLNMDYITIPASTKIFTSTKLFQNMSSKSMKVPQDLQLSELKSYFDGDVAYEFGLLAIKEYLKIDIGYYTAMPKKIFEEYFVLSENTAYTLTDSIIKKLSNIKESEKMEEYIREVYPTITCNLQHMKKLKYAQTLVKVNSDFIYYHLIAGKLSGDTYKITQSAAKKQLRKIKGNESYTTAQEKIGTVSKGSKKSVISSKGKQIEILNGSKINGLAASFKDKLTNDGFTVISVGDYGNEIITTTKILVKKEGMGEDLLDYFNGATVEQSGSLTNSDIQIILGKEDGF